MKADEVGTARLQPTVLPGHGLVRSWRNLLRIYDQHFKDRTPERQWIFRGQGCDSWGLSSYLERLVARYRPESASNHSVYKLEQALIREFQRKAHHFVAQTPHRLDTLEWLAMMRHYGAPTRLLDWTYSFFVAAYFACQDAEHDCAVWVINAAWCRDRAHELLRDTKLLEHKDPLNDADPLYIDGSVRSMRRFANTIMRKDGIPLVYPVNPFRMNERLTIQQGVFLCQGDVSKSFWDNLVALGDPTGNLFKIRIGQTAAPECLKELYRMNMNRATLYPGLDGFASSLGTRLAFPETLFARI